MISEIALLLESVVVVVVTNPLVTISINLLYAGCFILYRVEIVFRDNVFDLLETKYIIRALSS